MSRPSSVSKPNGKKRRPRPARTSLAPRCRYRRVLPGASYLITKKCSDDRFLIVPSPIVNQILFFALLYWAKRYGVVIHGFVFLSNHFHLLVTDARGRLPDFMRDFLKDTSAALQVATPVDQPVWDRKRYSAAHLLDRDAAVRKLVYVELNPARAGLTRPEDWPGLNSVTLEAGARVSAARPSVYFSSCRGDVVEGRITPLSEVFEDVPLEETQEEITQLRNAELRELEDTMKRRGRSYLGARRVRAQSRNPRGRRRVLQRNPRFATKNRARLDAAIAEDRAFEVEHELARDRWLRGHRRTVFPPGTYGFRRLYAVRTAPVGKVAA